MLSLRSAWKPALASAVATRSTRSLAPPPGSPTISRSPKPCLTSPGAVPTQVRCTTAPSVCANGTVAAMRPCGSTLASGCGVGGLQEPPRHAVHHRQHQRLRADQRREALRIGGQRLALEGDDQQFRRGQARTPHRPRQCARRGVRPGSTSRPARARAPPPASRHVPARTPRARPEPAAPPPSRPRPRAPPRRPSSSSPRP